MGIDSHYQTARASSSASAIISVESCICSSPNDSSIERCSSSKSVIGYMVFSNASRFIIDCIDFNISSFCCSALVEHGLVLLKRMHCNNLKLRCDAQKFKLMIVCNGRKPNTTSKNASARILDDWN